MSSGTSAVGDTCTAQEILCAAQASGSAADIARSGIVRWSLGHTALPMLAS